MSTLALSPTTARAAQLRDEAVYMLCGLWMISGLYIDGWAHQANKPESFFTPWHAVLYSGFGAVVVYSGLVAVRDARSGAAPMSLLGDDRLTTVGAVLFALGGASDLLWHELFGIEVDVEALISPTHLLLMIGGLLMVSMPVRSALRAGASSTGSNATVAASVGLALGVVSFFLMYLSPWAFPGEYQHEFRPNVDVSELGVEAGMASALVFTALLAGALLWTATRWRLPAPAATVGFTVLAIGQSGLNGFDVRLPVLSALAAGLVADVLRARGAGAGVIGAALGAALWSSYFGLYHVEYGVGWSASLWVGAVVFAALTGGAVGLFVSRDAPAASGEAARAR